MSCSNIPPPGKHDYPLNTSQPFNKILGLHMLSYQVDFFIHMVLILLIAAIIKYSSAYFNYMRKWILPIKYSTGTKYIYTAVVF